MNATQRRIELFRLLEEKGSAEVADLSERFGVTPMTIRRDFAVFEHQGLVTTNYGGVRFKQGTGIEPGFAIKKGQMTEAKQRIAKRAAEYIEDGDSVILDCGTTPLEVLRYIEKKKITVITNSWPAINYLHGNSRVDLYLAPGKYSALSAGAVSSLTVEFFKEFRADIVFISTQGFSPEYGASVPDPTDASVKKALLQSGKKKILLADSSKIGKKYLSRHALPGEFDCIICDNALTKGLLRSMKKHCNKVDLA